MNLSKRIFNPKFGHTWARTYLNGDGKFDAKELELAVKETIHEVTGENPDAVLLKDLNSACKV